MATKELIVALRFTRLFWLLCVGLCLGPDYLAAQTTPLTTFEAKALLAFDPASLSTHTLTLTGTVKRTAGSLAESGNIQFQASDVGLEEETWTVDSGERKFAKASFVDGRSCSSTANGKTSTSQDANCWRVVPWFDPGLALWGLSAGTVLAQDVTTTADSQASLVRLRLEPVFGQTAGLSAKLVKEVAAQSSASSADLLFDATTGLPQRLEYHIALSSDASAFVAVVVAYSDYRLDAGLMIPHHVQRYLQRSLEADVQLTGLTLR